MATQSAYSNPPGHVGITHIYTAVNEPADERSLGKIHSVNADNDTVPLCVIVLK